VREPSLSAVATTEGDIQPALYVLHIIYNKYNFKKATVTKKWNLKEISA
jgi:hypothetical protein